MFHEHIKYIEVDYYHVHEWLLNEEINTTYVRLEGQLMNLFTKSFREILVNCM